MDFETFLSSPRWRVLEIIANGSSSPSEISRELNTSVAYISQQLKLLEAANLVVKKRTGNAEKGKARVVFSLADDFLHLTILADNFHAKKLIHLSKYHKIILKIWLIENSEVRYYLQKLYWELDAFLNDIYGIFFDNVKNTVRIVLESDSKKIRQVLTNFLKDTNNKMKCEIVFLPELEKLNKNEWHVIYDSKLNKINENLKGGKNT